MLLQIPDIPMALPDSVPSIHDEVSMLRSLPADELIQRVVSSMVTFAINLAIAIVVFYVGRLIINRLYRFISGIFVKRQLDRSLTTFILSMARIVLYFILIVTIIGIMGIETTSFMALFASAGVAVGMALSGTLQNFAGGVLILLLKPYKINDYIEAQGYAGTVREIQIFHTIITTGDNKTIIIPNGGLSTGAINNWSRGEYRRVDWSVGISYGDSVDAARTKILEILASDSRVVEQYVEDDRERRRLEAADGNVQNTKTGMPNVVDLMNDRADRSPKVWVSELADSSVNLKITAWTLASDYWSVFYQINERIYKELPSAGVSFPFPQLDVSIKQS